MKKKTQRIHKLISTEPITSVKKEEILALLKQENPPMEGTQKYSQLIILVEVKKISDGAGLVKGEYYKAGKLEHRGSFLRPLKPYSSDPQESWHDMQIGQYHFYGLTLDSREPKLPEQVAQFFGRSFKNAKLQDFIPFMEGRRKE